MIGPGFSLQYLPWYTEKTDWVEALTDEILETAVALVVAKEGEGTVS